MLLAEIALVLRRAIFFGTRRGTWWHIGTWCPFGTMIYNLTLIIDTNLTERALPKLTDPNLT